MFVVILEHIEPVVNQRDIDEIIDRYIESLVTSGQENKLSRYRCKQINRYMSTWLVLVKKACSNINVKEEGAQCL